MLLLVIANLPRLSHAAPADGFFYLPPALADRVVFYQSFAHGPNAPDLNLMEAQVSFAANEPVRGLAGTGYRTGSGEAAQKKGGFALRSAALSVHQPITIMFWWRLDEPMTEETGFNVAALRGQGWISTFIAGKGRWCALREPTYVFQCYNFPGMENCNDIWGGRAWFEPDVWHHLAVTVSGAAEVRIYWDGQLRTQYAPKKRLFQDGEINSVELGASGKGPAMTLDEVIVMDRALAADEVMAYITAAKALAQIAFPVGEPGRLSATAAAALRTPVLTVQGDRFQLDDRAFKPWGIRVASGTADDAQCEHLIAQLDDYVAHGVNAVTVFYMGCRGRNYDPFSPDGRQIDPGHQRRMERIIRECARRNMIVVAGIFYQAAPFGLGDADAVRQAVRSVAIHLKPYRNVIINVCNEHNSDEWDKRAPVFDFREPERIIELCRIVHEVDATRLVGGGGYDHKKNPIIGQSKDVDVLLFDTAGNRPSSGELFQRFAAAGVTNKPMLNVETFGGWTKNFPRGVFADDVKASYFREVTDAVAEPGLSVFFHNNPWCQSQTEPMRYDLGGQGTRADPGIRWYFDFVKAKAVEATLRP
jgi:hypothetical protein